MSLSSPASPLLLSSMGLCKVWDAEGHQCQNDSWAVPRGMWPPKRTFCSEHRPAGSNSLEKARKIGEPGEGVERWLPVDGCGRAPPTAKVVSRKRKEVKAADEQLPQPPPTAAAQHSSAGACSFERLAESQAESAAAGGAAGAHLAAHGAQQHVACAAAADKVATAATAATLARMHEGRAVGPFVPLPPPQPTLPAALPPALPAREDEEAW